MRTRPAHPFLWLVLLAVAVLSARAQISEGKVLVTPSLVADVTAVVPGKPFQVGVLLDTAPHWHTYWEFPGDAGLATSLDWQLPEGFVAGPIQWPLPERLKEPGDIEAYAYENKVLLITTIAVPAQITDKTITIRVKASWLVCAEICVPGSGDLELTLPVADTAAPANEELFQKFQSQLPSAEPPPYELTWKADEKSLALTVSGLNNAKAVDLFPLPGQDQQVGHPKTKITGDTATITLEADGAVRGVLVVETGDERRGWMVSSASQSEVVSSVSPNTSALSLWTALLYGFLGGMILNLMPCVLPVISLKIFGFVRQAGGDPRRILGHGLAFVAGIFVWFLGLGLVIVGLKSAGHEVTWAFQFQNPWFNFAISCIVFVFALNLFGVFEIILPGRAATALDQASGGEGYAGSFAQGIFATLLATPCTAPFLGTALGFAFGQSSVVIMAMFGAVALGMGAPYLLLSAQPGWMKILPKPGAWMERVKQFMGFPLIATLLWLLFILGNQKGLEAVIWVSCFLLCLAVCCWVYGAFCGPLSSVATRVAALFSVVVILAASGWYFVAEKFVASSLEAKISANGEGIAWQPFSQKALDDLLAQGKPVFVDFTADWCLSCKFNERTAINTPAVREAFVKDGIIPMKADWTNANPEITAVLKKFGRVGVPFYLLYPAGRKDSPIILPELLTQQIVLDGLAKAASQ